MGESKTQDPGPNHFANGVKTWTLIAERAYEAHRAVMDGFHAINYAYHELPVEVQTAWEAAVRHAVDEVTHEHHSINPECWKGWLRPQDRPVEGVFGGG